MAKRPQNKFTWAQAIHGLGIRFLSSGKFVPTLAFILLLYAMYKTPQEKVPDLVKILVERDNLWKLLGWGSNLACCVRHIPDYDAEGLLD